MIQTGSFIRQNSEKLAWTLFFMKIVRKAASVCMCVISNHVSGRMRKARTKAADFVMTDRDTNPRMKGNKVCESILRPTRYYPHVRIVLLCCYCCYSYYL